MPGTKLITLLFAGALLAQDKRYLDDFDFLDRTIAKDAAAVKSKKLDWPAIAKAFRPRFAAAKSDAEHLRLVMELLASLRDSHTGVLDTKLEKKDLPSKWDGLYGGGLWFDHDRGRFAVRGVVAAHPLEKLLPLGSVLLAVDALPAWLALERERRRIVEHTGSSSDHSLLGSLGNRLLPFGEKESVDLRLLLPDGKSEIMRVQRWGPDGKAFDPNSILPEGVTLAERVTSKQLAVPWCKKLGFLKITGGMDDATVKAFHAALDALKASEALLLDCRGMDGGSDACAWEMNGRFFPKGVDNGLHGKIAASGTWQLEAPVVMLQDETEVSSAETFTWAMTETSRALTVGRPTGGWGIIPKRFSLPSGLAELRIGVNDRPTPITKVHTEGAGWPPDLVLPSGPVLAALPDPARELGLEVLRVLHAGVPFAETRAAIRALSDGDLAAFRAFAKKHQARLKGFDAERICKLLAEDLKAEARLELAALRDEKIVPDFAGAARRVVRLDARAKRAGVAGEVAPLAAALQAAKAEIAAQDALAELALRADEAARKAWLAKHGATRTAALAREQLWR